MSHKFAVFIRAMDVNVKVQRCVLQTYCTVIIISAMDVIVRGSDLSYNLGVV